MTKCKMCRLKTYGHESGLCVLHRKMDVKEIQSTNAQKLTPENKEIKADKKVTKKRVTKKKSD